ncbi:MAG: glycosyltransferase family 4 protein [Planctomycetota bacterium]
MPVASGQPAKTEELPSQSSGTGETIRVALVQPSLAKYRIPVFRELAARDGIDLTVYYGTRSDLINAEPEGFKAVAAPLHKLGRGNRYLLLHGAQWAHATRKACDVLVLNWTPRYATLIPSLFKARFNGVPTVLWGHGFSKRDRPSRQAMRKFIADRGSALLFYDAHTAQKQVDSGWDAERIFVAPNTVDHTGAIEARNEWSSDPDRLAAFRREQGLEPGPVLLYVSRLDPANRVDMLLRATANLKHEWPDVKTVVIGNGDEERERLRKIVGELGIESSVIFSPGIYDEKRLAPWFLSAAAYCYPENIGLSIIHAMVYGVPVVTSDRRECQNPEFAALTPGENGLTYAHGSLEDLSAVLSRLLSDTEQQGKLSRNAHETAMSRFPVSKMVDGMEAAIRYAYAKRTQG